MQVTELRQLMRISGLAAPMGDATRRVTLTPDPLRASYDGLHCGGVTTLKGQVIEGLDRAVALDAKIVLGGLDLLQQPDVGVTLKYPNMVFKTRGQRFTVRVSDGMEFLPQRLPGDTPSFKIETAALLAAVRYLAQIVGGPQSAPVLTGVRLDCQDDVMHLEATDGVAAGMADVRGSKMTPGADLAAVVPAVDLLAALEVMGERVVLRTDGQVVEVLDKVTHIRMATLADAAKFPDLTKLPVDEFGIEFKLPAALITSAAQASLLLHSQRHLDLVAERGTLRFVVSEQELGTFELAVGRHTTGDFRMKLDAEYLKQAGHVGVDLIVQAKHPAHRVVLMTGEGGWRYWITEVA